MLKSILKRAFFSLAPQAATAVMSARARAHFHRLVQEWGLFDINRKMILELGNQVLSGPFAGMTLSPMSLQDHVGPYLLGTYEMELHPWWTKVFQKPFEQIVNVGAHFGYYAVGLALKFPNAATIAFDTDWWARKATREMIAANHVAGVSVKGFCTPRWLNGNLCEHALIVCDCEGYEYDLLCSTMVPALASATMIVELHECFAPGVSSAIVSRFAQTHVISKVHARSSTPMPEVKIQSLTQDEVSRASSEVRAPQEWIFLVPGQS